jgi:hypothetical protein
MATTWQAGKPQVAKLKFSKLARPTEPEFRPRTSSKIFIIVIGTSAKNLLEKRLVVDVAGEIGGVLIADMSSDDLNESYNLLKNYLPTENIVAVPLTSEGEIIAGSKDMSKVLRHRHLYVDALNSGIKKSSNIINDRGITVIEVWCSTGGHSIVSVETLLKIQQSCKYRKVVLIQATEKLARRNEFELLTFFKHWASENEENQFFFAKNPSGDVNIDCANAIAISSTYGLPSADLTDFFANLCVDGMGIRKAQAFVLESICGNYPLYSHLLFWSRQNVRRTERVVAQKLVEIRLGNNSLAVLSGDIIEDFMQKQRGKLYDDYDIKPEIRQFNQIKLEKTHDDDFNFCVGKFELLDGVDTDTLTIDLLLKKMADMP